MSNEKWICLEEVVVRRQRLILDRVSWQVERGKNRVVLGANGSGKTTLLQLLAGYLWPTEGKINGEGNRYWTVTRPRFPWGRR